MAESDKKKRGRPRGALKNWTIDREFTQAELAKKFGLSRDTWRRLDRLKDFPEAQAQLHSGKLRLYAATVEAGIEIRRFPIRHEPAWAAETIHRRFSATESTALILELAARVAADLGPAYISALVDALTDQDSPKQAGA